MIESQQPIHESKKIDNFLDLQRKSRSTRCTNRTPSRGDGWTTGGEWVFSTGRQDRQWRSTTKPRYEGDATDRCPAARILRQLRGPLIRSHRRTTMLCDVSSCITHEQRIVFAHDRATSGSVWWAPTWRRSGRCRRHSLRSPLSHSSQRIL